MLRLSARFVLQLENFNALNNCGILEDKRNRKRLEGSMQSLLSEITAQADGIGPVVDVDRETGQLLVLTLAITRIIEQGSLDLSIWGSPDKTNWGTKPLAAFPQKSYCGMYSILLNVSARPEIKYLRVQWKMHRWTKDSPIPLFGFYVDAEVSVTRIRTAAVGRADGQAVETLAHALAS
jgi:hypothetical protein